MAAPNKHSLFNRKRASLLSLLRIGSLRRGKETAVSSEHVNKGDRRSLVRASDETITPLHDGGTETYSGFLREFPEYKLTAMLDVLRQSDFGRLDASGETYVDYMGGALYPARLVKAHADFLYRNTLGNTHSISNSSMLSQKYADEARAEVLRFLNAPKGYVVIFTANTTGALKLVGESYPFTTDSSYVLCADSHNSVHGIREYARAKGASVQYIPSTPTGGLDSSTAQDILLRHKPSSPMLVPSLFALTGLSNISNSKAMLSLADYAGSLGYHTLLDAAALVPTSPFSLTEHPVDAIAISFYKMFGFPTGVGALVVKESFLAQLKRPWFAGGTIDVVQVPGTIFTSAHELYEQFEDGTINYLSLRAVTDGLRFLSVYLPLLPLRLSCLLQYLVSSLSAVRHDTTNTPVLRILSRIPSRQVKIIDEQSETGAMLSILFLGPEGELLPNSFIEFSASRRHISLRTGCVCNPGGAAALLGIEEDMASLYPGATLNEFEQRLGRELGVVRISLGLASNFQDAWQVVQFAKAIGEKKTRQMLWDEWIDSQSTGSKKQGLLRTCCNVGYNELALGVPGTVN